MASMTSFGDSNSGVQATAGGNVITNFVQAGALSDEQCLRDLRITNPRDDKIRIENKNGKLLEESYRWILSNKEFQQWHGSNIQETSLFWIRGDPGKGKTMLLCGIIEELPKISPDTEPVNLSFFFCQADDPRLDNATAVLRGLIWSLLDSQSSLISHVRGEWGPAGKSLFEDVNAWSALSKMLTNILGDPTLRRTYLIIDALDECRKDLPSLLDLILQLSPLNRKVKWLVSSRNWPDIKERLNTAIQSTSVSLELNQDRVSEAVGHFIEHKVHKLVDVKKYDENTSGTVKHHLLSNSQGTFLWVALVCQELSKTPRRHAIKKLKVFPPGLDALYHRMIDQVRDSEDADICRRMLAVASLAYRPITLSEVTSLMKLPKELSGDFEALSEIIETCGSFLTLRDCDTIVFVHQSAREFLKSQAQIEIFPEGLGVEHMSIYYNSLQAMSSTLCQDIFGLGRPGFPAEEAVPPSPNPLASVMYSCVYWVDHLRDGWLERGGDAAFDADGGCLENFFRKDYLHWLEALSLSKCLNHGVTAMLKLEELFKQEVPMKPFLYDRIRDASRFIQYTKDGIEASPLQVYSSCILFTPIESLTKKAYQDSSCRPDWILNISLVNRHWSRCLKHLDGHFGPATFIAWSHDGRLLASADFSGVLLIWDTASGQQLSHISLPELAHNPAWSPTGED
ncbi:hypothetical protein N7470_001961 [Penicillium chermesinum]|nr:hypothetical protein N7470_001961 [Penicillium chermesinum]